jgi:hypothetical protein
VARGNNIFGVNDGIFSWDGDNFTLRTTTFTTSRPRLRTVIDSFQTEGVARVIRHNTFDVTSQNAALSIWNSRRNSDDISVDSS